MYILKTTDFFTKDAINKALYDKNLITSIADECSENQKLFVIYNTHYKIEFCFAENDTLHYLMIEEAECKERKSTNQCEFVDDIDFFSKKFNEIATVFRTKTVGNDLVIGNALIHFEEENVDSLYYFP